MTSEVAIALLDPETIECPYAAYQVLRDEAPVYFDVSAGVWVITRYEDVRRVLLDTKTFVVSNRAMNPCQDLILETYDRLGGIKPAPAMSNLDNPEHRQLRNLYNDTFSPRGVAPLEGFLVEVANELVDGFVERGRCEFMAQFGVPFPLRVIGHIMGIESADDLDRIKVWTDAWVQRRGLMQTRDEVIRSTELEVEAQRFFQPIIDRLRSEGNDSGLLARVVRADVPEWGRRMNDAEAQTACLQEMFVAGAETTTSALANAVVELVRQPALADRLREDPALIPRFIEELLRAESPVQGHFRRVTQDVAIHGVTIPEGSLVHLRYGAANRDEREFESPTEVQMDRQNVSKHLGFGLGAHTCLGASLARLELRVAIDILLKRLNNLQFVEGANDFAHKPNFVVRSLETLHLVFASAPVANVR